jgi:hypothetical protein
MRTDMKILSVTAGVILVTVIMTTSACRMQDTKPQPYEYTGTNAIKQGEYYENERIKDAERTVVMTLEELGYPDLEIAGGEEGESPAIEYTLPDDGTQGPDKWYIIDFHFLIEFEEDTGGGFCDVQAVPLGSVQFETIKVNDSPYIRIVGNDPASSSSTRMDIRYYAYIPQGIIVPGKNEITFKVEQSQRAKVKSLTIYNDTSIELTSVPPYDESTPPPEAIETFYGVSPELTAKLERICLADPRIEELVKDREYILVVDGHTIENKDYNLALGVRLKDNITSEQFQEWMNGGRQDSDIIREYVGVLDIGYSASYDIVIDMEKEAVIELIKREKPDSGIPELTPAEKQRAVEIALADATLRQILEGKEYDIAPDGIGVWHSGTTKLGAVFEVYFKQTYKIDCELPRYQSTPYQYSGEAGKLMVGVLLEENRVAEIIPLSIP